MSEPPAVAGGLVTPSALRLFDPLSPIPWPSVLMHQRYDKYLIVAGVIKDRERKASNQSPSYVGSLNGGGFWKLKDTIRGLLDSVKKIRPKAFDPDLIETRGFQ